MKKTQNMPCGSPHRIDDKRRKSLISQIDDTLEYLQTPCGKERSREQCTDVCISDGAFADCSEWKAPIRNDGYASECFYVSKAKRLLKKFKKFLEEKQNVGK